jgi:Flp pilus assembly protein TadD
MATAGQPAAGDPAEALRERGLLLWQQGTLQEALASFRALVELRPEDPLAWNQLGNLQLALGDPQAARQAYTRLTQLLPQAAEGHHNLAVVLRQLGELEAALVSCGRALELAPEDPDAHSNLARLQVERGEPQAAVASYRRALALQSEAPDVLSDLGGLLWELDDLPGAIACCHRILQLNPGDAQAHHHLGILHWDRGDLQEAAEQFSQALSLQPDHAEAACNLGMVWLSQDRASQGWPAYEARLQGRNAATVLPTRPPLPLWQGSGSEPPGAQTPLLLMAEQGLGDTLQFMRYLPALREFGWGVRLCAPPSLHGLIRASGIDADPLSPQQAAERTTGEWLPLLSLPMHLGVTPGMPLLSEAYLCTHEVLIAQWRERLAEAPRPLIGINWQGNPNQELGNFRGRSLPLETFAPLARACGGSLLALQKGPGSEQLEACSFRERFVACQEQVSACWDFLETAAIIANCDLVISSDTAVAHLAGGLGHPTWVLLKQVPDWRWGLEGDRTPWYPSMRLFRQRDRGDWDGVIARVVAALASGEDLQQDAGPPAA